MFSIFIHQNSKYLVRRLDEVTLKTIDSNVMNGLRLNMKMKIHSICDNIRKYFIYIQFSSRMNSTSSLNMSI